MTKRSRTWQRLHIGLTLLCAGTLLVLGVFYADGWIDFRKPPGKSDSSKSADQAKLAGPQIRAVPLAEQFVETLGDEAYCYEFEGTWIDFWIEVEMDGKTQRLGAGPAEQVRILLNSREEREEFADPPRGRALWIIQERGDQEIWSVAVAALNSEGKVVTSAYSRGIVAPQPDHRPLGEGPRPWGETVTRVSEYSFTVNKPIPLATRWLMADGEGTFEEKTKRKVQLMCGAVEL